VTFLLWGRQPQKYYEVDTRKEFISRAEMEKEKKQRSLNKINTE
tara:strand:+ start:855 stop:986 length:132 start_codon:yes stop_codon:yes gene_type:complete